MMDTLNLFDEVLGRARRFQEAGQWRPALALLRRLDRFRELSPDVAEEAQARLGEILLKRRCYHQARKRLRAALRRRPANARYHFLLGLACHADPAGDKQRALRHYQRSLELAPHQVRCRGEAGLLAIDLGRLEEGLALLEEAVNQAPGEAGAVGRWVTGLCLAGRPETALAAVRKARFLNPKCPRLRKLWADLHLDRVRREQETASAQAEEPGPILLPFTAPAGRSTKKAEMRYDGPAALPGPHLSRLGSRVDVAR